MPIQGEIAQRLECGRIAAGAALAVLLLRPPVEEFGLLEFSSFDQIIDTGYRHAMKCLAAWPERDKYIDAMASGSRVSAVNDEGSGD